mmetsp:Transcript_19056/g.50973  ORF Transcript_19056/g.50973 Transcript_19056/m.50973 type:complete len:247 (-) Transcript_19056:16-756(-)
MGGNERKRYVETTTCENRGGRHKTRAQVDENHLVVLRSVVILEEHLLIGRGEPVEHEEQPEQPETKEARSGCTCRRDRASHQELSDATSDRRGNAPIHQLVTLPTNCHAPDHDGHHLEALSQHLDREAHVLQRFVLASTGVDVGHRHGHVFPERCHIPEALSLGHSHTESEHHRHHAVHEDQKDGRAEPRSVVISRHDSLLKKAVDQEHPDDARAIERAPQCRFNGATHRHGCRFGRQTMLTNTNA